MALLLMPAAATAAEIVRPIAVDLSPLTMFMNADIVVKAVMVGLTLASLATWTVLVAKKREINKVARLLRQSHATLSASHALNGAMNLQDRRDHICVALLQAATDEITRSHGSTDIASIKERISLRLSRIEAAAMRELSIGMSILATIGATSPFIGLFGTVWGIMNSFIGISKSQTTNLAVVAPGIAEALLATAIGLVAAIPAVMFYNHLGRGVNGCRALVSDAAALVMILATRDLDHGAAIKFAQAAE